MTQTYIERLKAKELENLHNAIQEKENRINYLEQQNEILSKIIHKDNKLIPAMELSVKNFLSNPEVNKENGEKFLKELSEISQERYGIIEKYKNSEKKLPLTNVFLIDTTFNFMLNKATQNNIDFDLDLSGSVQYMTDNIINEKDLNTLLADLIENAIIATKLSEIKKIIVNIGVLDNNYFIDIIDSGIPFKEETFNKLGMEKATTHKGEGGSGIGMLSTFEFLRKTNASFVIKEFNDDKLKFTKKLSIIFNNEHQFIVDSYRAQELKKTCIRNDIIFCNN